MKLELISKHPAVGRHSTPLLFVHGAWHGAWCWDVHFLDYFAAQGFSAHAVSLRGHGQSEGRNRLRCTRVADYVEDVADTVRQMPKPPVLIGHSMGGFVVQKYLEQSAAPAAVLLASAPPAGILATTLRVALRHPLAFAKVNLTLSLYPLVASPRLARELLFSEDLPDEHLQAHASRLQDESYLAFLDMLALDLPKPKQVTTPVLVLGGARDATFHTPDVEATARAYGTRPQIVADAAHDMMLDPRWEDAAARIANWLRVRKL